MLGLLLTLPVLSQVSEIMDPEAGHVHRDGVVLACEVLECCPWFEFADLDVYGNTTEEEADDLSTDPDELELGELAVEGVCQLWSLQCHVPQGCAAQLPSPFVPTTSHIVKAWCHMRFLTSSWWSAVSSCQGSAKPTSGWHNISMCSFSFLRAENGDPIPSEADEELFHSLLAKAGMHLANAEGDESLVHLDADALQVGASLPQRLIVLAAGALQPAGKFETAIMWPV